MMTRKGWLLFIAIAVIWGIPYLFIRIAVRELDPVVVVFAALVRPQNGEARGSQ